MLCDMELRQVDGNRVRLRRKDADLSVLEVTARMARAGRPVHPDTVYKIERGERQPSADILRALARALKCPADELLEPERIAA